MPLINFIMGLLAFIAAVFIFMEIAYVLADLAYPPVLSLEIRSPNPFVNPILKVAMITVVILWFVYLEKICMMIGFEAADSLFINLSTKRGRFLWFLVAVVRNRLFVPAVFCIAELTRFARIILR
ncbi:MAG: hypothetical protein J6Y69_10225 [Treponema sp.]|nr:hypothetical protein [Treponema sp.]